MTAPEILLVSIFVFLLGYVVGYHFMDLFPLSQRLRCLMGQHELSFVSEHDWRTKGELNQRCIHCDKVVRQYENIEGKIRRIK